VPSSYCLLGRRPGTPLGGISKVKRELALKSGLFDFVMHDWRRSARSTMARLGVPAEHAERAIGHVVGTKLQRTYDTHNYESEIKAALETWQRHLLGLVAEPPAGTASAEPPASAASVVRSRAA
jgi:hypothetical protein